MDDLAEWLLKQIAEDEQTARAAIDGGPSWRRDKFPAECAIVDDDDEIIVYDEGRPSEEQADHIAAWDPARVLAECEAKRRLVELCKPSLIDVSPPFRPNSEFIPGVGAPWAEPVLRELGAMYAKLGRPGYQES